MYLETMRKKLRGTVIHRVYTLLKYDLYLILVYRVIENLRRGRTRKVRRMLGYWFKSLWQELPRTVAIDVVSVCNLRCPLCSVPPFLTRSGDAFMPFEKFKTIVDRIDVAMDLCLVYAGEPFLHPKFLEMIHYVRDQFYSESITNGTLLSEKNVHRIIDSGLDALQISFDGFSKESFERYRIGADFDSVKENILRLIQGKKEKKSRLPHITITFLINAYNEEEVEECKRFFLAKGADRFFAKAINLNVHRRLDGKTERDLDHWLPKKANISLYENHDGEVTFKDRAGSCTICLSPMIRCDGEVLLCCHDIFNTAKIGNIFDHGLKELWNTEHYKKMRLLAKQRKLPVCQKCGK